MAAKKKAAAKTQVKAPAKTKKEAAKKPKC